MLIMITHTHTHTHAHVHTQDKDCVGKYADQNQYHNLSCNWWDYYKGNVNIICIYLFIYL